jgi:predicted Holliday junction resolvase-like endonuclease
MPDQPLVVILAGLLGIVILAWAWTHYQYMSLQRDLDRRAMAAFNSWRQNEVEQIRAREAQAAAANASLDLELWKAQHTQEIRRDAIRKSDSVTVGKITEHLVPYLSDFEFNPKDARFLGSPVDFIVFDGLSEGEVRRIHFVEIKTGKSTLNTRERRVRDAVQAGQVEWSEIRLAIPVVEAE